MVAVPSRTSASDWRTVIGMGTSWADSSRLREVTITSLMPPPSASATASGDEAPESVVSAAYAHSAALAANAVKAGILHRARARGVCLIVIEARARQKSQRARCKARPVPIRARSAGARCYGPDSTGIKRVARGCHGALSRAGERCQLLLQQHWPVGLLRGQQTVAALEVRHTGSFQKPVEPVAALLWIGVGREIGRVFDAERGAIAPQRVEVIQGLRRERRTPPDFEG
jgi:hypothetical protein